MVVVGCVGRDGFPAASVAFFDQTSCPTNWAAYTAANNRIILPAAGASGVLVGNGTSGHHQHSIDFTINLLASSAAVGAGSFSPIATSGLVMSTSLSDFGNDGVDQPTLTLLACRKSAAAETNAVAAGQILGGRELESDAGSCSELDSAAVLAIALIVDPERSQSPTQVVAAAPPSPATVPMRVPVVRAEPARVQDSAVRVLEPRFIPQRSVGADAVVLSGILPATAFGAQLELSLPFVGESSLRLAVAHRF